MAVHHVEMNRIGTGVLDLANLLAQPGEISGENRRGDFRRTSHTDSLAADTERSKAVCQRNPNMS